MHGLADLTRNIERRATKWVQEGGSDPRAAYVRQLPGYGVPEKISASYADFLPILAGYDKRGVNPLGSTNF